MSSTAPPPRLLGRQRECEEVDRLLGAVRGRGSRAMVVRGEPGVGKTSLLDYLESGAAGCRAVRAAGVQSEMELAYAGLHQLCASMLEHVDRLPDPQRAALGTVFGLTAGPPPDRFLVGLATLSLLSEVAEERPLVCLVDDVQWLDRASVQVLAFVARRLLAESVALVLAVREPHLEEELAGLPMLAVAGLPDDDARALLDAETLGQLDERVRDRIVAETRGNPLALLELPRGLSAAELAGGFGRPDAQALISRIEQSFLRRLEPLPAETRLLLLLAAAEPLGDPILFWRTAEHLGLRAGALVPAEAMGLVEVRTRVRFRHPLLRSAVYRAAAGADRRQVHGALAAMTDPTADPDRRAWHRAQAATGPEEEVAHDLERAADRARARGGIAAAAALLQRATELTPDTARRGRRAVAAAHVTFEAAAPDVAAELLAVAEMGPLDALQRASAARLRAQIMAERRRREAPTLLLEAAQRLQPLDAALARDTYLDALGATVAAGRLGEPGATARIAHAAQRASVTPGPPQLEDLLLDGLTLRSTAGYAAAVPALRQALELFRRGLDRRDAAVLPRMWLAWMLAGELWDDEMSGALAQGASRLAQESGLLILVPVALEYEVIELVDTGELSRAAALVSEAPAMAAAAGYTPFGYGALSLAAWRGDETQVEALVRAGTSDARERGEGMVIAFAEYAAAVLHNGSGRTGPALSAARRAGEHEDFFVYARALVELVEAAVREGSRDEAERALGVLTERALASGTDQGLGLAARSRALLRRGAEAESAHREAVERLGRTRKRIHLARAHLGYGEWLRRENRRVDARDQLRRAHELLDSSGVRAFAERARRELAATGETVRPRAAEAAEVLTAQESHIARLAAEGGTNPEIGARLFLSPRTVEYHLGKVFTKLGVSSRRELGGALAAARG